MKRITGIGGVFIKAKDPVKLRAWYKTHLGIDVQTWGGASFTGVPVKGKTAWFVGDGSTFAPSNASFMINYRVADLHGLLRLLRAEGCQVLDKVEQSDFGIFGWVMDPEGNKVELWQPPEGHIGPQGRELLAGNFRSDRVGLKAGQRSCRRFQGCRGSRRPHRPRARAGPE